MEVSELEKTVGGAFADRDRVKEPEVRKIVDLKTPSSGESDRNDLRNLESMNANDAITLAQREGFAPGSVIFLDVESMRVIPDSMRAYYGAWQRTVLADGRYLAGTYAHQRIVIAGHQADAIGGSQRT